MKDRLILEFPNFISEDKVAWLRAAMHKNKHLYQGSSYNREGDTVAVSKRVANTPELQEVEQALVPIFAGLAERIAPIYKPNFPTGDTGYEYHVYLPGNVCKEHVDGEVFLGGNAYEPEVYRPTSLLRYATALIYLTTNEGGELVFPDAGVSVKPEAGKAVVFPPYGPYVHHVMPAKEDREIFMTWFVYNNLNVSFL